MLELLILYSLFERDLTTYGVRKNIVDNFGIYLEPSLGAIHPAIQRLIKKGCITSSKNISDGGQKSCYNRLTPEGKRYFNTLFTEDFLHNAAKMSTQVKIRFVMLPKFKPNEHYNDFFVNTIQKVEAHIFGIQNFIAKKTDERDKYVKISAEVLLKELKELKNMLLKLQAEGAA